MLGESCWFSVSRTQDWGSPTWQTHIRAGVCEILLPISVGERRVGVGTQCNVNTGVGMGETARGGGGGCFGLWFVDQSLT